MNKFTAIAISVVAISMLAPGMIFAHGPDGDMTIFTNDDWFYFDNTLNIFVDTDNLWGTMNIEITDPVGNIVSSTDHILDHTNNRNAFVSFYMGDPNIFFSGYYDINAKMINSTESDYHRIFLPDSFRVTVNEPSQSSYNSTEIIFTNVSVYAPSPRTVYYSHVDSAGSVMYDRYWNVGGAGSWTQTEFNPVTENMATGNATFSMVDQLSGLTLINQTYYYSP